MFITEKRSIKITRRTRLYNRPESSSYIYARRDGERFATEFLNNERGWIEAQHFYIENDSKNTGTKKVKRAAKTLLSEALKEYIITHEINRSDKTIQSTLTSFKAVFDKDYYLTEIDEMRECVIRFRHSEEHKNTTKYTYFCQINAVFNWFIKNGYTDTLLIDENLHVRPNYTKKNPVTKDAIEQCIKYGYSSNKIEYAIILDIIYNTTLRISRVLSLTVEQIIVEQRGLIVKRKKPTVHSTYVVPLIDATYQRLMKYINDNNITGNLFPSLNYHRLQYIHEVVCKSLNIEHFTFHAIRRRAITDFARVNIDMATHISDVSVKVMYKHYVEEADIDSKRSFIENIRSESK